MQFVKTQDGSPTIFDAETGEHHHSLIGAYTEARYKFAETAKPVLQSCLQKKQNIRLLDLPFGLGYNLIATLDFLKELSSKDYFLECVAIEKDEEVIKSLAECPFDEKLAVAFEQIKELAHGKKLIESTDFSLNLIVDDLLSSLPELAKQLKANPKPENKFDLIFYDPFSPKTAAPLWSTNNVLKYFSELLSENGLLITYTASNKVRKGLQEAGLFVAPSVAVGRKMPGTVASKSSKLLEGFGEFSEETKMKIAKATSY